MMIKAFCVVAVAYFTFGCSFTPKHQDRMPASIEAQRTPATAPGDDKKDASDCESSLTAKPKAARPGK